MSSETDPLLPQGNSAPEITGYGFSKPSTSDYHHSNKALGNRVLVEEEGDGYPDQGGTTTSPLRTLLSLFSIVVLFGLFITLLIPNGLRDQWQGPKHDPHTGPHTIETRVNKILSENPLIGLYISTYLSTSVAT